MVKTTASYFLKILAIVISLLRNLKRIQNTCKAFNNRTQNIRFFDALHLNSHTLV